MFLGEVCFRLTGDDQFVDGMVDLPGPGFGVTIEVDDIVGIRTIYEAVELGCKSGSDSGQLTDSYQQDHNI